MGAEDPAVRAERERLIARICELADSREHPSDPQAQGIRWAAEVLKIEGRPV